MAKNIDFMGAIFPDVPSVKLPQQGGGLVSFDDTTDATATAEDIAQGKTAYVNGSKVVGTASGGSAVIEPLSVTANGTYTAPSGVDGYSPVTVNVSGGGGGSSKSRKDINFFDYDGTIIESFTASEWASQASLPSNPSHSGLTAQGWNYTKAQIDTEVTAQGRCDIGQMYITESGDTEIDIELHDGRLAPNLGICPNGTVEIDWGDGSAKNTVTGTSLTTIKNTTHTYAEGAYTIKLHVVSGEFAIVGTGTSSTGTRLLWKGSNGTTNGNRAYQSAIKAVRLGNGASVGYYAFEYCYSLTSITIPNSVTSIGGYAFAYCYALTGIVIPNTVNTVTHNTFNSCYSLTRITIPNSVTSIGSNAFSYCYTLTSTTIPSNVPSIVDYMFSVCYSLTSITIPNSVTSIGSNAFNSCGSLGKIIFKSTTPPTVSSTNAFPTTPSDRVVYVPQGSLEAYQNATNYTNIKNQMVEMP